MILKRYKKISIIFFVLFLVMLLIYLFDEHLIFDEFIYEIVRSLSSGFFDKYFIAVTRFGNPLVVLFIVLNFILLFRNRYGITLISSAFTSFVSNSIIKNIFRRIRPEHIRLIKQGGFSFPSGHAMISICVYGFLLYLVVKKIENKYFKYLLSLVLIILILSIGISRIYVGVHYPTDVFAGYFLGIFELTVIMDIFRRRFGE